MRDWRGSSDRPLGHDFADEVLQESERRDQVLKAGVKPSDFEN
jgi:hypothetical protein